MNLFRELMNLGNEFNKMYTDNIILTENSCYKKDISFNVFEKDGKVILNSEVPGVKKDDIELQITGNVIKLNVKREVNYPEKAQMYKNERTAYNYEREFELPFRINNESVEAKYNNGILSVILEKHEDEKPRKVEIKVG